MKVLVLSNYYDGTGYSRAGIDYTLALDAAGVDVVCRSLKLNEAKHTPPARILELEKRSGRGCEVILQHTLPSFFEYRGKFDLNVGLFEAETSHFRGSGWANRCNLLDLILVGHADGTANTLRSGVTVPVESIPHPCDQDRYSRSYPPSPAIQRLKDEGNFVFYTIGESVRRKNLGSLLKAYLLAFTSQDPVVLAIKTWRSGMNNDRLQDHLMRLVREAREGLKIPEWRQAAVTFLLSPMSDSQVSSVHTTADCFVQASYAEGWSYPAWDAMAFGKTPIVPRSSAYLDYVDDTVGWTVAVRPEPVFGDDAHRDLYLGDEDWWGVDIHGLAQAMQTAYQDEKTRKEKATRGIARAQTFSYEVVGPRLAGVIRDQLTRKMAGCVVAGTAG